MTDMQEHGEQPTQETLPDAPEPLAPEWLAEVTGEHALAWVRERNAQAMDQLASDDAEVLTEDLQHLLDRPDRIPPVAERHGMLYSFWVDAEHPRGLWRRTTWESYLLGAPSRADRKPLATQWEPLLDLDAESASRGMNLAWGGAQVLTQGPLAGQRALITLSDGGSDTSVTQEYDLATGRFLPWTEDGFRRPPSKGTLSWGDAEGSCVIVSADFAPGSLSSAGYPRQVRRLTRGENVDAAQVLVTAGAGAVGAFVARDPWGRTWLTTMPSFYSTRIWLLPDDAELSVGASDATAQLEDGAEHVPDAAVRLDVPESCAAGVGRDWVTIELREPWEVNGRRYSPGTLLAAPLEGYLAGQRDLQVLFEPTSTSCLASATWTCHHLVLTVLDDVVNRLEVCTPPAEPGDQWGHHWVDLTGAADLPGQPSPQDTELRPGRALLSVSATALNPQDTDYLWISASGWTTPSTLTVARLTQEGEVFGMSVVRQAPSRYDARGVRVTQHLATSTDGTRVPYFQVGRPSGAPGPTLVEAYGAFGHSLVPGYEPVVGKAWLEQGGTLVVANTRGGGEYGPSWHHQALGHDRHRVREDLAAVLSSVVDRGVSTPSMLSVHSSSAGALGIGDLLVHHPELMGAVVMEVPLLDLRRYSHLLAGSSWVPELGDPDDPAQWEWMREMSPLHALREGVAYPPVLLLTSTRDDRVHPWHARATAYRLLDLGQDVTFFEGAEGGHAGAVTNAQRAQLNALTYEFIRRRTWR